MPIKRLLAELLFNPAYHATIRHAHAALALEWHVQAGDLTGAEATAQEMPYWDTRGEEFGKIAKAHLTNGNVAKARQLADTMRNAYAWPGVMRAIAETQFRAGAVSEAKQTLMAAQQNLRTWHHGDHWNGYPREEALFAIVQAQLSIGDITGANQTARSITRPEYQNQALSAIEKLAAGAGTARKDVDQV